MLLWIAFALLTTAVLAWVLAPLARLAPAGEAQASAETGAHAVYRDQLAEIEAERAAGLLAAAEAEAAKLEISADCSPAPPASRPPRRARPGRADACVTSTSRSLPPLPCRC